jgi:signal transduction histidine kinase
VTARAEAQQRQFVTRGRPGAFVVSFVGFGIAALLSDSRALDHFLVVLLAALLLTQVPAWIAMARGVAPARVAGAVLVADIPMVAALTAALDSESLLVVAYFAPIAFAALIFGAAFTLLLTALATVATLVVGAVFVEADGVTILADLVVLTVTGGILAGLAKEMHGAQTELARDRASDQAALHLAERIRFPQNLDDVLRPSAEELGRATEASRCLIRLRPRADGTAPVYEWDRPGAKAAGATAPPPFIRRVFETGEPLVIDDTRAADPDVRAWADDAGARALVAWPVSWSGEVMAVFGFTDDRPRDWEVSGLSLLQRAAPIVGAALAQAESLDEAKRVAQLREDLVARVSHELRTPLTSTIGFLRTLERQDIELDDAERARFLAIARAEAERLAKLVDDLLELARLERGTVRLDIRRVDIGEVAERAARGLELPRGRTIALEVRAGEQVDADADRLLQVLSNLIANAVSHGEGTIVVSAAAADGAVEIVVSDEGSGIPEHDVSHLFEPFARGGTGAGGTGLGLAIARALIEAHGGTLSYRPSANGRPHAFVVSLPATAR